MLEHAYDPEMAQNSIRLVSLKIRLDMPAMSMVMEIRYACHISYVSD